MKIRSFHGGRSGTASLTATRDRWCGREGAITCRILARHTLLDDSLAGRLASHRTETRSRNAQDCDRMFVAALRGDRERRVARGQQRSFRHLWRPERAGNPGFCREAGTVPCRDGAPLRSAGQAAEPVEPGDGFRGPEPGQGPGGGGCGQPLPCRHLPASRRCGHCGGPQAQEHFFELRDFGRDGPPARICASLHVGHDRPHVSPLVRGGLRRVLCRREVPAGRQRRPGSAALAPGGGTRTRARGADPQAARLRRRCR